MKQERFKQTMADTISIIQAQTCEAACLFVYLFAGRIVTGLETAPGIHNFFYRKHLYKELGAQKGSRKLKCSKKNNEIKAHRKFNVSLKK